MKKVKVYTHKDIIKGPFDKARDIAFENINESNLKKETKAWLYYILSKPEGIDEKIWRETFIKETP